MLCSLWGGHSHLSMSVRGTFIRIRRQHHSSCHGYIWFVSNIRDNAVIGTKSVSLQLYLTYAVVVTVSSGTECNKSQTILVFKESRDILPKSLLSASWQGCLGARTHHCGGRKDKHRERTNDSPASWWRDPHISQGHYQLPTPRWLGVQIGCLIADTRPLSHRVHSPGIVTDYS